MEYLRYWSFREPPFGPSAARFFFVASPQRDSLSWIQDHVVKRQRLGLMICQSGCGTTTLLQRVSTSNGFDDCATEVIYTSGRQTSVERVFANLASTMGIAAKRRSYEAVTRTIEESGRRSLRTVWLVDGLGKHSAEAVMQISRRRLPLTVIATVTPSLLRLVTKQLGRRVSQTHLNGLNETETHRFVEHSLQVAGCRREIFTKGAISALHALSDGRLRQITKLTDRALMHGAAKQSKLVTSRDIDDVAAETSQVA